MAGYPMGINVINASCQIWLLRFFTSPKYWEFLWVIYWGYHHIIIMYTDMQWYVMWYAYIYIYIHTHKIINISSLTNTGFQVMEDPTVTTFPFFGGIISAKFRRTLWKLPLCPGNMVNFVSTTLYLASIAHWLLLCRDRDSTPYARTCPYQKVHAPE